MSIHRPKYPNSIKTNTRHLYTATVTSTIKSTNLITTTSTAVANSCPNTATTTSDTIMSAASTMMRPLRHSTRPAVTSSGYGSSSHSGLPGSRVFPSQSRSSIFVTRSNKRFSSMTVSNIKRSPLNGLITEEKSSSLLPISKTSRATTVRTKEHTMPHFDGKSILSRGRWKADRVSDHTVSSRGPSVDMIRAAVATERETVTTS